jgi:hypothetical protein
MPALILVPLVLTVLMSYAVLTAPAGKFRNAEMRLVFLLIFLAWGNFAAGYFAK